MIFAFSRAVRGQMSEDFRKLSKVFRKLTEDSAKLAEVSPKVSEPISQMAEPPIKVVQRCMQIDQTTGKKAPKVSESPF
ncbi:hypothetical protein AAV98_05945 [Bacillus sp. CHD6a]|nr:hypothetical protein AAV98_05945 [Bacillus sp. CHD6a]